MCMLWIQICERNNFKLGKASVGTALKVTCNCVFAPCLTSLWMLSLLLQLTALSKWLHELHSKHYCASGSDFNNMASASQNKVKFGLRSYRPTDWSHSQQWKTSPALWHWQMTAWSGLWLDHVCVKHQRPLSSASCLIYMPEKVLFSSTQSSFPSTTIEASWFAVKPVSFNLSWQEDFIKLQGPSLEISPLT